MAAQFPPDQTPWPPSARQVYAQLAAEGPATNQELVRQTGLARRTLGRTLRRLVDAGFLERLPSLHDTRRFYYRIAH